MNFQSYIVLSLCLVVIAHKVTFSAATVLDYLVLTSIFFSLKVTIISYKTFFETCLYLVTILSFKFSKFDCAFTEFDGH